METNRFRGLTNGGRQRTADRSVAEQLRARLTGQIHDVNTPTSPIHPAKTAPRIQLPETYQPPTTTERRDNRIHPNTPPNWRIDNLPPGKRRKKRHPDNREGYVNRTGRT